MVYERISNGFIQRHKQFHIPIFLDLLESGIGFEFSMCFHSLHRTSLYSLCKYFQTISMGCALCRRPLTIDHCSKTWCFLTFLVTDLFVIGVQTCHLARFLVSTLAWWDLGVILGRLGAGERTLCFSSFVLSRFGRNSGPVLKFCGGPWTKKGVFVRACFQVSFSADFRVWSWMSRIGKAFGMRCLKNQLSQKLAFSWFQDPFSCFFVTLGNIVMTLEVSETGLRFEGFSWLPWGTPRSRDLRGGRQMVSSPGLITPIPGSLNRYKRSWDRAWQSWDLTEST